MFNSLGGSRAWWSSLEIKVTGFEGGARGVGNPGASLGAEI